MNQLQMLKKAMIAYVTNALKSVWSAIAYPLTIVGKKNCDVADYRIYGNSVQDGEPTPEAPIEIQSVGELTTKNILDVSKWYSGYLNNEGGITYTYLDFRAINKKVELNCKENTQYTFSADYLITEADNNSISFSMIYTDGTWETHWEDVFGGNVTGEKEGRAIITSAKGKTLEGIRLSYSTQARSYKIKITNMMIEEGATATKYEPYYKYKIPVTVRGKNLLDVKKVYADYANDEGGVTYGGRDALWDIYNATMYDGWKENTRYTFSANYEVNADNNRVNLQVFYTDGTKDGFWNELGGMVTGYKSGYGRMTTKAGKTVENMVIAFSTGGNPLDVKLTNIQLEEGAAATEYEPYIEPQTTNIYLDEPLRRDRDAVDVIDFEKGAVLRRVVERTYDGTEDWQKHDSYEHTFKIAFPLRTASIPDGYAKVSHYKGGGNTRLNTDGYGITGSSWYGFFVDYRFSTVDEFKAFLAEQAAAGTPLTLVNGVYEWHNNGKPKEESIDLPKLPQFKGTTIYEVQEGVAPSGVEVCYYG